MNGCMGTLARIVCFAGIGIPILSLSGCALAVLPVLAGGVGAAGFSGYKLVQTASGASMHVGFVGADGKEVPVSSLSAGRRVAIWPDNEGEVAFANRLSASGKFDVIPPAKVAGILTSAKTDTKLSKLTTVEQTEAFGVVCRDTKADLVFAALGVEQKANDNSFSLNRATVTTVNDLLAFSCVQSAMVWRDRMTMVIELGEKMPSKAETAQALADAWADRLIQAQQSATKAAEPTASAQVEQ